MVIPAFGEGLREDTLASAMRAVRDVGGEIVLVDDGLATTGLEMAAAAGADVRVVRSTGRVGPAAARTLGLRVARGRYVKFLDHDDLLEPGSLEEEIRLAEECDADVIVAGWGEVDLETAGQEDSGRRTFPAPQFSSPVDDVLAGRGVPTGAALYRRRHVEGLSWDPGIVKLDDWDWFCRVALKPGTRVARKEGVAYWWRQHSSQVSARAGLSRITKDFYTILDKIEAILLDQGELTERRRLRLAQYNYKMLRMLALEDWSRFKARLTHIEELDPRFRPSDEERSAVIRLAARTIGTKSTIWLYVRGYGLRSRLGG